MSMSTEEVEAQNAILTAENNMDAVDKVKDNDFNKQVRVAAKLLGYKKMPPDITTFINDDYYLGNITRSLYPFWRDQLVDIFPTPIHTRYPIIIITGSIGSGKSTVSRLIAEYMKCRVDHLVDPHRTLGLMPGKRLVMNFLMPNKNSADIEFPGTMSSWEQDSPYFRDGMLNENVVEYTTEGLIGLGQIGRDVLGYVLSELNFLPKEKAMMKLDTALKRWTSRFKRFIDYLGFIIIDTSTKNDDSIAEEFAQNNPYGDRVKLIHTTEWEVKRHLNYYFRKGSFEVYKGDSLHSPFIVSKDNPITPDLDPDRIIKVPEELRPEFTFNLERALMDQAGECMSRTDRFIQSFDTLKDCFCLPKPYHDVIDVDFFDKDDKLIYQLEEGIRLIPRDKILFIHYDIGVTSDKCGLAISYFDKWRDYGVDKHNQKMQLPYVITPIAVSVSRRKDQETSIFKLQEFLIDLSDRNEIYFSADTFASRQLMQNLTLVGIKNRYLSVDRTDQPYITYKTLMQNHLWQGPKNQLLMTEVAELRRVGNKVDHPSDGSKDCADAVCGSISNLYDNLDEAGQLSNKYIQTNLADHMADRTKRPSDAFQDMVETMFNM